MTTPAIPALSALNQGEVAAITFAKGFYESNKPAVLAAIQNAEGGIEGAIINAIKNAPVPGGLVGTIFKLGEPSIEAWVANLVFTNGPEVIYTYIDNDFAYALAAVSK